VPSSVSVETFTSSLPIKAGDLIGLDLPSGSSIGFFTGGGVYSGFVPRLGESETRAHVTNVNGDVAFNADIQPAPGVTSIKPRKGSVRGGTTVVIHGHDFSGSTKVAFAKRASRHSVRAGSARPVEFSVDSDTQITAIAPKSRRVGAVDVRVTNPVGTSPVAVADRFTYLGCVVPKLVGKTLRTAKRLLRKGGCRLGSVVGPSRGSAHVTAQQPKAGSVRGPGARVRVKTS
jgi:hypothetical protein